MKKLLLCLALPLFLLTMSVPAFAKDKTGKGEKVIENKLYSITLPSDWEPGSLQNKDGTPYERNAGPYHLYIFQWNSPKKGKFFDGYGIFLQSYERRDGKAVTMADMEKEIQRNNSISGVSDVKRSEQKAKPGQKQILITRKGQNYSEDKGWVYIQERIYYLIYPDGQRMHLLKLFVTEDFYQRQSNAEKLIQKIFASFRVKGTPPSQ